MCDTQVVLWSSAALNVPVVQSSHFDLAGDALATNFFPAAHFVTARTTTGPRVNTSEVRGQYKLNGAAVNEAASHEVVTRSCF